jgi:thiol-disulfide isomerase/thioredoxin
MMRVNRIFVLLVFPFFAAAGAPPDSLTLGDLANRPDRWPPSVSVQHDFRFANGATIHTTDALRILKFDGSVVVLSGPNDVRFSAKPEDCGLLEAANRAWTGYSAAQRAIDPQTLAADRSLWPLRVAASTTISGPFGRLPTGSEAELLTVADQNIKIVWPHTANRLTLDFASTDLFTRARAVAAQEPSQRPSHVAEALGSVLVDVDGRPVHDDHLGEKTLFALYFGANWCAPCHAFSPALGAFMRDALPKHPELAAAFLSNDNDFSQSQAYLRSANLPFPGVPLNVWKNSPFLSAYTGILPHLVIVDRFGRVLAVNADTGGNMHEDPELPLAALGKLLGSPSAGQ